MPPLRLVWYVLIMSYHLSVVPAFEFADLHSPVCLSLHPSNSSKSNDYARVAAS